MVRHRRIWLLWILLLTTGGIVYLFLTRQDNPSAYEGTELTGEATDFQLTDHTESSCREGSEAQSRHKRYILMCA